jgi:hypothetical protein
MTVGMLVDSEMSDRELVRNLRAGVNTGEMMPENMLWHTWVELSRRGMPEANVLFIGALRSLHGRRVMSGSNLSTHDGSVDEHRLSHDAMLGDLWKAYKRCIRNNRTGPASEILKEIEIRLEH